MVHGGMTVYEAAQEIGVDPIIAQLRLPDLCVTAPPSVVAPTPIPAMLPGVLRRMVVCVVPVPAYDQLRSSGNILHAAASALCAGLSQPLPEQAKGKSLVSRRPLAVPVPAEACRPLLNLAREHFGGDYHRAGGWAIARGVGMALLLPSKDDLVQPCPAPVVVAAPQQPPAPPARTFAPPRRRPDTRAPLPDDSSVPNGDELRTRREALGLSQRDLAAAGGFSRGLVAEIERGRRRHILTRLRMSETLVALERDCPSAPLASPELEPVLTAEP